MILLHSVVLLSVVDRFVSESGIDEDGCGETAETPCRTMSPVFAQMLAELPVINPDPITQLDDAWNKSSIYPTTLLSNWQSYWDPDSDNCKLD